jgi:ubiquinone/menaquinone biosynthesis C-methylase UbiE
MAQPSRFWNRHAKGYAKRPVADEASYQKKLVLTRDYLNTDMEVLEFGCGTGTTALALAPLVKYIHAIDISTKMLEIARTKAETAGIRNVAFVQSGLDDLNGSDEAYDVVMGHSILHLLDDKEAAIARVYGILKPGGVFISSTACLGGTMPVLKVILPIGRFFGLLPLVTFFTADDLVNSLTDAGFQIDHRWQPGKDKAVFIVAKKV